MSLTCDDLLIAIDEWREAKDALKECRAGRAICVGHGCERYEQREIKARVLCNYTLNGIIDFGMNVDRIVGYGG